jgi:hypothetical protein
MDEYTFILLAKLKADRLALERKERARQQELFPDEEESRNLRLNASGTAGAPRTAWFSRHPEWREQS